MYFFISLKQIIIMFILMAVGFLCRKINLLHEQTNKELTHILLYVVSPCIILNSLFQPATPELIKQFIYAFLATILVFSVSIVLAKLIFSLPKLRDLPEKNTMKFTSTYSNGGFMGIPLVQAMMGVAGTFFSVPYLVVYNIFLWSHGVSIFKKEKRDVVEQIRTIVLNPNIIFTIIGLIIFLLKIKMPVIVTEPIKDIVGVNTPLSMIVIGANLSDISVKMVKSGKIWLTCLLRNLVFPLLMVLMLSLLPLSHSAYLAIAIMVSCPIPGLVVMLSLINDQPLEFPTQALCLSTILSVITLPLVIMIATMI